MLLYIYSSKPLCYNINYYNLSLLNRNFTCTRVLAAKSSQELWDDVDTKMDEIRLVDLELAKNYAKEAEVSQNYDRSSEQYKEVYEENCRLCKCRNELEDKFIEARDAYNIATGDNFDDSYFSNQ